MKITNAGEKKLALLHSLVEREIETLTIKNENMKNNLLSQPSVNPWLRKQIIVTSDTIKCCQEMDVDIMDALNKARAKNDVERQKRETTRREYFKEKYKDVM